MGGQKLRADVGASGPLFPELVLSAPNTRSIPLKIAKKQKLKLEWHKLFLILQHVV